jgi:paraquat-inducible protein A
LLAPRLRAQEVVMRVACKTCGLVQRLGSLPAGTVADCARCGAVLRANRRNPLGRTAAFSLAALLFYWPANVYPILTMELYGAHSENTVFQGVVSLFDHGQRLVAVVVFLASIVIPLLKLLGLIYLVTTTALRSTRHRLTRAWVYRAIDVIGPWAMLDVFLLAILVSLVKLGELASVRPGRGLFAFAAVVVLTILASASFDPALIWERAEERR